MIEGSCFIISIQISIELLFEDIMIDNNNNDEKDLLKICDNGLVIIINSSVGLYPLSQI